VSERKSTSQSTEDIFKNLVNTYLSDMPKKKREQSEILLRIFAKTLNLPSVESINWKGLTFGDVAESRNKALAAGKSAETANSMVSNVIGVIKTAAKSGAISGENISKLEEVTKATEVAKGNGPRRPGEDRPDLTWGSQIFFSG
jgi:hypothetical protein